MSTIVRPPSRQTMPPDATRVFKGAIFDVYQWQQMGYDGKPKTFEKLKRPDTATVIPVTADGRIILVRQEQPGKEPFYGLAGGRVDEGEDVLAAAQRELLEETGYASDDWNVLYAIQPITKIDWAVFVFVARGCEKRAEQQLDGAEKIDLVPVSFDEFLAIVCRDDFGDLELKLRVLEAKLDAGKMQTLKTALFG